MHPQVDALLTAPDGAVSVATLNTVHDLLRFATWEPELLKQTAQRLLSLLAAAPCRGPGILIAVSWGKLIACHGQPA